MRSYPTDSPQAAARIVALTLLADGHLSKTELDTLDRLGAAQQLGLSRDELLAVLHALCEDLLHAWHLDWSDACRVDPRTLRALLAEVQDPELRQRVLALCTEIVEADAHVADGEAVMLDSAGVQWGLQRRQAPQRAAAAAAA